MTFKGCWRRLCAVFAMPLVAITLLTVLRAAEPPRDAAEDMLPVDSQWKGKLTQTGKTPEGGISPNELNAVLTITHRSGEDFEAELRESIENLDVTFLVRGRIVQGSDKSLSLQFQSHDVKGVPNAGFYYINVPYTAKLAGDGMKGTWAYEEKENGTALEGEFTLKRHQE